MVAPKAYAIGNLPQFKIKMDMNKSLERSLLMTFFEKYNIPKEWRIIMLNTYINYLKKEW